MEGITVYSVGERVGDYEVMEVLGAGGFGQVYKVRNTLSDRIEAMKVLLPSLLGDSSLTERFVREIKVQAALRHPNIVSMLGVQKQDGRILMFLEYIDGITLDKALGRGPLSPGTTASIIAQVLDALAYAHGAGVVHRDVKPANIMIQRDGGVKLMDFGIARFGQDRKLTSTGQALGSLHYMSPEQINAVPDIDGRTDLYSLGIVMYQSLTGTKPFDGPSDFSIMAGHLNSPPIPPIALEAGVPPAINEVVLQAVEKNRDQRFQTAGAFRHALDQAMGGRYPAVEIAMPGGPAGVASPPSGPVSTTAKIPRSHTGPTASMTPLPTPTPTPTPPPMPPPRYSAPVTPPPMPPPAPPPMLPPQMPMHSSGGYPPPQPPYIPPPPSGQSPVIYVNVAQNAQQAQPQQPHQPMMNAFTQQAIQSQMGGKSPVGAAILGFFFSWAGALYVGKPGMAFLLFCAEIAVGMVGCAASCSSRSGDGWGSWSLFELMFHCFTAWQCFKWATLRNLSIGIRPYPPPPMPPR